MFATHQKTIQAWAQQDPANTAKVVEFVLLTIQRRFDQVAPLVRGDKTVNTLELTKRGIQYAKDNAIELHAVIHGEGLSEVDRIMRVLEVPGLGLPKAGFVLQLCRGTVGCLDSHNLARFGLKASAFATSGKSLAAIRVRARAYVETCERLGGCEYLWDSWCELIAVKYPKLFTDKEHVSRDHVVAFNLEG